MTRFLLPLFLMFAACDEGSSSDDDDDDKSSAEESLEDGEKLKKGQADDAVEFNDGIVGLQTEVMIPWQEYHATEDPDKEREYLADTKKACKSALKTLKDVKPYKGGKDLARSATKLFEVFMEMIEWNEKALDLRDAEDFDALEAMVVEGSAIEARVDLASTSFDLEQRLFASANNMVLEDSVELPEPEGD